MKVKTAMKEFFLNNVQKTSPIKFCTENLKISHGNPDRGLSDQKLHHCWDYR